MSGYHPSCLPQNVLHPGQQQEELTNPEMTCYGSRQTNASLVWVATRPATQQHKTEANHREGAMGF
jgi:hypothetical protein